MLEVFKTSEYDKNIAVINGEQSEQQYSYGDLKSLIAGRIQYLNNKKENVVLLGGDNFSFIINFFASVYSGKNIYLITEKSRLNDLDIEYSVLGNVDNQAQGTFIPKEIDTKKVVINFYTSGSSGKSKIIKKSLFNLLEEGRDLGLALDINRNPSVISTTTMCHLFGMTFHLMFPLCNGLVINTTPVTYPENVNIENSVLVSTPAFLGTKVKHELDFNIPPKYIISAGSKLDEKIYETLENESKVIEIYGSTESGVIAYKTAHNEQFELFPNVNINIKTDNVEVCSNYTYGGKTVINDKLEIDGRKLVIKNRTDRLFKIYDKRVSAEELEQKLNLHEFVENSYIMSFENKLVCLCALSEQGKEYILKNNTYLMIKTLKMYMFKYSEIIPQKWRFIDQIPMNQMGKINKKLIEHMFNVNLSLPIIIDREQYQDTITYQIFMYKNCNFFDGHFPEFKLVPGVLQLYLAKEFANAHFGLNIGEGQYKRIKFSNIIAPNSIVKLKLTKTDKQVVYEYFSDEKTYSSGAFELTNVFEGE